MKIKSLINASLIFSVLLLSACDSSKAESEPGSTKVIDGSASIVLPPGFVKMPQAMLEVKYPMAAQRPNEAWYPEVENGKVSIAFSKTKNPMQESQINEFAQVMKKQMAIFKPTLSMVTINGKKMGRLEMTTPAEDGNIYNVMQFSSYDGKLLISTFNVTEDLKDKYLQSGKDALSTIKY